MSQTEINLEKRSIIEIFKQIMNVHELPDKEIHLDRLGGMTNCNFKINMSGRSYVLRIPGKGTEEMIDRKNEIENSRLSNQLHIAPEIIYFDVKSGIKLTPYIGRKTLNRDTIQLPENLEQVISHLRRLHTSNLPFKNKFNVFQEIENYENLLKKTGGSLYEGYSIIRPEIFNLAKVLKQSGTESAPCHNDLVPENFVKREDRKVYLIDWEYSGINDPIWDLGALFLESDFTKESRQKALDIYYKGNIPVDVSTKIVIYQIVMDFLWSIWAECKKVQGNDFGSYGTMRFQRAIRNLIHLNL